MSERPPSADLDAVLVCAAVIAGALLLVVLMGRADVGRLRDRERRLERRAGEANELAEQRRLQLDGALEQLHDANQRLADAAKKPAERKAPSRPRQGRPAAT